MAEPVIVEQWVAELPYTAERVQERLKELQESNTELRGHAPTDIVELGDVGQQLESVPIIVRFGDTEKDLGSHAFVPSTKPAAANMAPSSKLIWVARYGDESVFCQYEEDGTCHSVDDINRDGLRGFSLLDKSGNTIFHQVLRPGMRFFYRRRTALQQAGAKTVTRVMHIVGYDIGYDTLVWPIRTVSFIYEDNFHIVVGDFKTDKFAKNGLEQWQYPIKMSDTDRIVIK